MKMVFSMIEKIFPTSILTETIVVSFNLDMIDGLKKKMKNTSLLNIEITLEGVPQTRQLNFRNCDQNQGDKTKNSRGNQL